MFVHIYMHTIWLEVIVLNLWIYISNLHTIASGSKILHCLVYFVSNRKWFVASYFFTILHKEIGKIFCVGRPGYELKANILLP